MYSTLTAAHNIISRSVPRSAWDKGVKMYALELLAGIAARAAEESREPDDAAELEAWALNGASDWAEYSEGGCALIRDSDIAARLCSPSELRRSRGGARNPNRRESWLDCQKPARWVRRTAWCAQHGQTLRTPQRARAKGQLSRKFPAGKPRRKVWNRIAYLCEICYNEKKKAPQGGGKRKTMKYYYRVELDAQEMKNGSWGGKDTLDFWVVETDHPMTDAEMKVVLDNCIDFITGEGSTEDEPHEEEGDNIWNLYTVSAYPQSEDGMQESYTPAASAKIWGWEAWKQRFHG